MPKGAAEPILVGRGICKIYVDREIEGIEHVLADVEAGRTVCHEKAIVPYSVGSMRKQIILAENEVTRGPPGKYVGTYTFRDRPFEVRWTGVLIPYTVFNKDQRVTHAVITEKKHLIAVLENIKGKQDKAPPKKLHAINHGKAQRRLELKARTTG